MKQKFRDLLNYLSLYTKPQTSEKIASSLNISVRSVKTYVSEINHLYQKKMILSSRNGYELNHSLYSNLHLDADPDELPQTNEERAFYIIKEFILNHSSKLDLFELCDTLGISYSTVKTVISKMNKTYSSYQIEFVCENDTLIMIGNEKNKRKLISYIINEESKTSFMGIQQLKDSFPSIHIEELAQLIIQIYKQHHYYLNDFAFINLMLHLAIIIDREANGNSLQSNDFPFAIQQTEEETLIQELCTKLEASFYITLNCYERSEIYLLFKANANYSLPLTQDSLRSIVGDDILKLTTFYVQEINILYLVDLSDRAFTTPFALHLRNLIFRAQLGKYTMNPMGEAIKLNNPLVFDMAIFIALDLSQRFHVTINEDEIAFIAMHIGAEIERQIQNKSKVRAILLYPDYHNMHITLLNQIMLLFGNQITMIRCIHQEEDLMDIEFELLFTTIPLRRNIHRGPVIQLSPVNLNAQIETIQDTIAKLQSDYKNYKLRTNFNHFFEDELFIVDAAAETKDEIIAVLCERLENKNYVDADFMEKVHKRENAATTAFGCIAIPHSMDMDAIKTSVAVAISKKGFQWGTTVVNIVLLLAINKADKRTFRELYESLIALFSHEAVIQEVKSFGTFQQFKEFIYLHTNA